MIPYGSGGINAKALIATILINHNIFTLPNICTSRVAFRKFINSDFNLLRSLVTPTSTLSWEIWMSCDQSYTRSVARRRKGAEAFASSAPGWTWAVATMLAVHMAVMRMTLDLHVLMSGAFIRHLRKRVDPNIGTAMYNQLFSSGTDELNNF